MSRADRGVRELGGSSAGCLDHLLLFGNYRALPALTSDYGIYAIIAVVIVAFCCRAETIAMMSARSVRATHSRGTL